MNTKTENALKMAIEPKESILSRLYKDIQNNTYYMNRVDKSVPAFQSRIDSLEFRRDQYGLSKVEFAGLLGMQPSHYSEFTKGHRELPLHSIRRAYAIGVPHNLLLKEMVEI